MPRKSKKRVKKQTPSRPGAFGRVGQILLPMIAGIAATKADLTQWVYEQGLTSLHELLRRMPRNSRAPRASMRRSERIIIGGVRTES